MNISNGYYENNDYLSGFSFFHFASKQNFHFQNHTLIDNNSRDADGSSTYNFLSIGAFNIQNTFAAIFTDIKFENSPLSLFHIGSVVGSPTQTKTLILSGIEYKNLKIHSTTSLISFEGIITESNIAIIMNQVVFENIIFETQGILINFMHQLPHPLIISDSFVKNVTSGSFNIETYNSNSKTVETLTTVEN